MPEILTSRRVKETSVTVVLFVSVRYGGNVYIYFSVFYA